MCSGIVRPVVAFVAAACSAIVLANDVVVTATVESQNHRRWLVFKVKNIGTTEKKTVQAALPWGHQDSLLLFAALRGKDLLARAPRPIDIPSNTEIVLKPGEEIAGRVDLQHRFGDGIDKAVRSGEILLVWASRSPFDVGEFHSGHVVIPQMRRAK